MAPPRGSILCIGTAILDTIALVDRLPGEDERVEADVTLAGGGNAATAAVAIARLGIDVEFAGVVGADEIGKTVVRQLEAEGVGTRHIVVREDISTTHSVVVVTRGSAARSIITQPAAVPAEVPTGYDMVHVDKVGYAALRLAGRQNAQVSLDDGNAVPDLDLRLIDLYVPTATVLTRRYRADPLSSAHRAITDGASTVVVTAGSQGSFAVSAGQIAFASALSIEPLSSLGAGDVFHGALLAALTLNKSLPEAIRFANVTAALSCRALDGRSGIPTRAEVEEVVRDLPREGGDAAQSIRSLRV